ncbi:hypothetical protein EMIHUDRAFT_452613 [Emiliania huxleyi CCMP1516]|uniref:CRAL-TRIO domain-containing protein n=2 Tax=Emiliania huxleyi TaxID=2903 RepID=A0A0D3IHB4_EMIH1|nr:hypothetical protein EMIHUDRAFT_452613 [Emiliania huxleyi CCMP1516]EOD10649.1 hypothetical protein EMIHUDRAFT_452613 [Emiliania huxleyi CCMP1516]|eukprot:XP_005763078.1 hypothetical protein EMIHUDRAFT_452613 [Emiliania huxleyi CCMP1516]
MDSAGLSRWPEVLMLAQVVLLYLLTTQLAKIQSQLKLVLTSAAVASVPAAAGGEVQPQQSPRPSASSVGVKLARKPTLDNLLPDVPKKGFAPACEWALLSPPELEVAQKVRAWLGEARFATTPRDLLVTFIRGYAYRADWAECAFVFLERALGWREEVGVGRLVRDPPLDRALFEEVCPSGPVGFDRDGHVVLCERIGQTDESYIQHQAYTREVARLYNAANSKAKGRRLYKVVYVLDLRGMGVAHLNKRLLSLIKEVNELFGWYYPETVYQFYIINAPLVFRTAWSIIKPWIHPITAAKFAVLGGDWRKRLDQAGISLTGGDLPRRLPSWMAEAERLLERETLETLSLGYMPHDDLASLGIQAPG